MSKEKLSVEELRAQLDKANRENEKLKQRLETVVESDEPKPAASPSKQQGGRWRAVLSALLIVVAVVLAPAAVVGARMNILLTDTDEFVATFAPLAKDPDVQKLVTDQTVALINEQVDLPALTGSLIDSIEELGAPPRAVAAADALKGPINAGLANLIETTVSNVVTSDAFATTWDEALRLTHSQLLKTMQGDPNAVIAIAGDGSLNLQLAPILESLKTALVDQGLGFAERIPVVDTQIPIATDVSLSSVQLGYGAATIVGQWLQWVALGLLGLGVLVARQRRRALVGAGIALTISTGVMLIVFAILRAVLPVKVPVSNGAVEAVLAAVLDPVTQTATAVLTVAILLVVVAWFTGPGMLPTRVRTMFGAGAERLRETGDRYGVGTGAFGVWCDRWQRALRVVIAVGAGALVLFVRPLTTGLAIWTLVGAIVLLLLLELLRRPASAEGSLEADADADAEAAEEAEVELEEEVEEESRS